MERVKLTDIKVNPNNPRKIKKERLEKLKKSIQEFPQMLELRPLVLDSNNVVLGGNMRLKALTELGYEDVPVLRADNLSKEDKEKFVIKDNVSYGEWDWDIIKAEWKVDSIYNWGLELPKWLNDDEKEPEFDEDINHKYLHTYINSKIKQIVMFLSAEQYEQAVNDLGEIMEYESLESNSEAILFLINFYNENRIKNVEL